MDGVLPVLKPPGMTSHDVVDFMRGLGLRKAGHTGTLDPAAAGLLLLCVGRATRLSQYLVGCDKTYRLEVTFGVSTDSGDAEGTVTARGATAHLTAATVAAAQASLVGERSLPVPRFSAVKRDGQPLHRSARRGDDQAPPERLMRVHSWALESFTPGPPALCRGEMSCASGTYVRSLVTALAAALGTEAYLSFLLRTRVGAFLLEQALSLEEIEAAATKGELAARLVPPAQALGHLPTLALSSREAGLLAHGTPVLVAGLPEESVAEQPWRALDPEGTLVAVVRPLREGAGWRLRAETVLAGGSDS